MNKEQQELLNEAWVDYKKHNNDENGYECRLSGVEICIKPQFINKCETDDEFSEKWGLKIKERELSDVESVFHYEKELYSPLRIIDQKIPVVPSKLISITYKNQTIESYDYRNTSEI